ncbi:hypothetical protein ACFFLM_18310 [Deinococcus oregonensis]|uniref:Uncharacterized protein n=1 Tax=Deinococcus oregonensis TaxID=1805970 RepID=A0ABV6B4U9_9DEIO
MNEDRRDSLPALLIIAPMMPFVLEALEREYQTFRLWEAPDQAAFLQLPGPAIRGVATNGGVGLDAVDLHEAARRDAPDHPPGRQTGP